MHLELSDFGLISKCEYPENPKLNNQMIFYPIFTFIHDRDVLKFVTACKVVAESIPKLIPNDTSQLLVVQDESFKRKKVTVLFRFPEFTTTNEPKEEQEILSTDVKSSEVIGKNGNLILDRQFENVDIEIFVKEGRLHLDITTFKGTTSRMFNAKRIIKMMGGILNILWLAWLWQWTRKKTLTC